MGPAKVFRNCAGFVSTGDPAKLDRIVAEARRAAA
jgi:hypothetical protein